MTPPPARRVFHVLLSTMADLQCQGYTPAQLAEGFYALVGYGGDVRGLLVDPESNVPDAVVDGFARGLAMAQRFEQWVASLDTEVN